MEIECPEADEQLGAAGDAAGGLQGAVLPGVAPHLVARLEAGGAAPVETRVAGSLPVALHVMQEVVEAPHDPHADAALAASDVEGQLEGLRLAGVLVQGVVEEADAVPGGVGEPGAAVDGAAEFLLRLRVHRFVPGDMDRFRFGLRSTAGLLGYLR